MRNKQVLRVLLVEDEKDDAYIIKQLLHKFDLHSYCITHVEGLDGLKQEIVLGTPDVILLDLGLAESKALHTLELACEINPSAPIVVLTSYDDDEFGEEALKIGAQDYLPKGEMSYSILTRTIRFAMERFELVKRLRDSAYKDGLTQLPNRSAFMERLASVENRQQRYGGAYGLFFLDLDKFKPINDEFGHQCGDRVLALLAQRLVSQRRKSDFVARIGGDEFAFIVPNFSSIQELKRNAERLCELCRRPFSVPLADKTIEANLAVSIGIAISSQEKPIPFQSLIDMADKAMYFAKSSASHDFAFANGTDLYAMASDPEEVARASSG